METLKWKSKTIVHKGTLCFTMPLTLTGTNKLKQNGEVLTELEGEHPLSYGRRLRMRTANWVTLKTKFLNNGSSQKVVSIKEARNP